MKDIRINAIVIEDFNDSQLIDKDTNAPYHYEANDIIKDMPRWRFNQLKAIGKVKEYKELTIDENKIISKKDNVEVVLDKEKTFKAMKEDE